MEITETLRNLRAVTRTMGAIHEEQARHLKVWAQLAVPQSDSVEIRVDPNACNIVFAFDTKRRAPRNFKKLLTTLDEHVKWLLGQEWQVQVLKANKEIYLGARGINPPQVNQSSELPKSWSDRFKG